MTAEVEIKVDRGRRAPGQSLPVAVEMIEAVHEKLGGGPFARISIAEALGHSSENGASNRKIGSLTHYGLLEQNGGTYRLSDLGRSVCVPTSDSERSLAISKAALEPVVYSEIYKQYAGKPLPRMLENLLQREFGIARGSSSDCAKLFVESMQFAGFLKNGVLQSEPVSAEGESGDGAGNSFEAGRNSDRSPQSEPVLGSARINSFDKVVESGGFHIPLSGNRVAMLRLPRGISAADIKRVCSWLELMEDVLTEDSAKPANSEVVSAAQS